MDLKVDTRDITKNLTVTVKLPKTFLLRIKLGLWLMKAGSKVVGCNLEVEGG